MSPLGHANTMRGVQGGRPPLYAHEKRIASLRVRRRRRSRSAIAFGAASPEHGVRVLGVSPGPVLTDRVFKISRKRALQMFGDEERYGELLKKNPFGRPASVDEVAASVVFLTSGLSSYTSGTIVTIDGGFSRRAAV